MIFSIVAIVLALIGIALGFWALSEFADRENGAAGILSVLMLFFVVPAVWFQTHRIVSTQHVGVSKSTMSQKLDGLHSPGIMSKPFLGSVYEYPAASKFEKCERYTPAIKGSYGITIDLCFYYDASTINWITEINRTGSLEAAAIMSVWRNSVVGDVARSVKEYTPEALSDNRAQVELDIFKNVNPWFTERGISLTGVSFKNWNFTSEEVSKSFDTSIVSQRKITEQTALFEAAKISREREKYEAETAKMVAEWQKDALDELGLSGQSAIDYLWIKMLSEQDKAPDVLILGASNVPVSIPAPDKEKIATDEIYETTD